MHSLVVRESRVGIWRQNENGSKKNTFLAGTIFDRQKCSTDYCRRRRMFGLIGAKKSVVNRDCSRRKRTTLLLSSEFHSAGIRKSSQYKLGPPQQQIIHSVEKSKATSTMIIPQIVRDDWDETTMGVWCTFIRNEDGTTTRDIRTLVQQSPHGVDTSKSGERSVQQKFLIPVSSFPFCVIRNSNLLIQNLALL